MTESKNVSVKTIAVALIGAGLLAFIGIGLWKAATPAPTPLQGQVDARTIEVAPKIPGRIEKVLVKEGDTVEAGAVMVKISIPEISAKLVLWKKAPARKKFGKPSQCMKAPRVL